ncbi:MAG: tetratricopeptide repeat protein [Acidimicrobiales bacterium]
MTGDAAGALALYREVAADSERALGPDDRDALTSRHNVAYYERTAGDRGLAIEVDVLQRAEVLLSADDPLIDAARWLKRQLELTVAVASEGRLPRERRELNDAVDLHGSRPG